MDLTCLQGNTKGWALQILEQYEETNWPEWLDHTTGTGDETVMHEELSTLIEQRFTQGN